MTRITGPERAAILAGLRMLQRGIEQADIPESIVDIATNNGIYDMPDGDMLDELCETLNFADTIQVRHG